VFYLITPFKKVIELIACLEGFDIDKERAFSMTSKKVVVLIIMEGVGGVAERL
jgi:hypothetical protein